MRRMPQLHQVQQTGTSRFSFRFPCHQEKAGKDTVCDDFISEWRQFVMNNPYFNLNHWLKEMGAENQQAQIFVKESDEIMRKLSLKSSQEVIK